MQSRDDQWHRRYPDRTKSICGLAQSRAGADRSIKRRDYGLSVKRDDCTRDFHVQKPKHLGVYSECKRVGNSGQ
jgi:hypothetical protein